MGLGLKKLKSNIAMELDGCRPISWDQCSNPERINQGMPVLLWMTCLKGMPVVVDA
jgi:hypothetical protein